MPGSVDLHSSSAYLKSLGQCYSQDVSVDACASHTDDIPSWSPLVGSPTSAINFRSRHNEMLLPAHQLMSIFSPVPSEELYASARYSSAAISAFSPTLTSSQLTKHSTLMTPDWLNAYGTSTGLFSSGHNTLRDKPPVDLDVSPFQLFKEAYSIPPLFETPVSPVVRRSLGDATPVYSNRRNADALIKKKENPHGSHACEPAEGDKSERRDISSISPSPCPNEQNTPFLQKLSRKPEASQKLAYTPLHNTVSLGSPFKLRVTSSSTDGDGDGEIIQSSPCAPSSSKGVPTSALQTCRYLETPVDQNISSRPVFSPLSELSSLSSNGSLSQSSTTLIKEQTCDYNSETSYQRAESSAAHKRVLKRRNSDSGDFISLSSTTINEAERPSLRKKAKMLNDSVSPLVKLHRTTSSSFSLPVHVDGPQLSSFKPSLQRGIPSFITINPSFPNFYKRYPISSFFYPKGMGHSVLVPRGKTPLAPKGSVRINIPRSAYDLYTPRFTKGVGHDKDGLCPICFEPVERGGAGCQKWLSMKRSAYKCYHMQYFHGISPTTGQPFSPPIEFHTQTRTRVRKREKAEVLEGKCHKCLKWVAVEGVKIGPINVMELFWWKHAAVCHKDSRLPGDQDIFIEDEVFQCLKVYEATSSGMKESQ